MAHISFAFSFKKKKKKNMEERNGEKNMRIEEKDDKEMEALNDETFLVREREREWRQCPRPRRLSWPLKCGTQGNGQHSSIPLIYYSLLELLVK